MLKIRIIALLALILGIFLGWHVYTSNDTKPFRLGLDLSGGSYLVYKADTSELAENEISDSMDALRDTIERRINAFGIAEPSVTTETHSLGIDGTEERLVVELPGVTDLDEAVELIGQTPLLEFKYEAPLEEQERISREIEALLGGTDVQDIDLENIDIAQIQELEAERYVNSPLTGKYLEKSQLQFSQAGVQFGGELQSRPIIALSFNREGAELFEELTRDNVGRTIAIFLDGIIVSAPRVNQAISGGQAIIEGDFTLEEAKETVGRLNSGALPIPIELISTSTIGPSLGQDAVDAGVYAGVVGLILVGLILILWYRLPGLIAVIALGIYTAIMLWMFKFIPITLTSAGITGFIISIGIAVDANILIFERMKEELKKGAQIHDAVQTGFARAWASIRDANISSIISALFLFWFGTALIKGFALTFGLGILISMITAVTITRYFLLALTKKKGKSSKFMRFIYQNGFNK
ncbi:MAG: protein translocase subunit SecD [Candidatus Pacebacteria bacterium]|nr:protein translocase subunit SecD [Candidatus Paceibacterota bacterium]